MVKEAFVGYAKPAVAVDSVILRVKDADEVNNKQISRKALQVLLVRDNKEEKWRLPGSIMRLDETPGDVLDRIVKDKAQVNDIYFEQLYTSADNLYRDPRGRVISMIYIGVAKEISAIELKDNNSMESKWFWITKTSNDIKFTSDDNEDKTYTDLAYDHSKIISDALDRIRGKLLYTNIGFKFADRLFTVRELERVFIAIYRKPIPSFRRIIMSKIEPTGKISAGKAFRPAELYKEKENTCEVDEDENSSNESI